MRKLKFNRLTETDYPNYGYFHQWANSGDCIVALVEINGGTIEQVPSSKLKFVPEFHKEIAKNVVKVTLESDIRDLGLSTRAYNALHYCFRNGTFRNNVSDVCNMRKKDLLALRNIGKTTVDEIEKALWQHGFIIKK